MTKFDNSFLNALSTYWFEELPPDIREEICSGLRRKYEKPPVKEVEFVLRRKFPHGLGPDGVRRLLFFPTREDAELYPALISSAGQDQTDPEAGPTFSVQITSMMVLYLRHSHDWSFSTAFILAGGLRTLVDLMVHTNLHLRGQVLETLLKLTDEEFISWHDPPADAKQIQLMSQMLQLTSSPLMKHIEANFTESFPGGSMLCLQLFAFFASFMRKQYCKDNVLRLSVQLLDLLKRWSESNDKEQHEQDFAKRLYDDFSRFGEAPSSQDISKKDPVLGEPDTFDCRVVDDRTVMNSGEYVDPVEALKRRANASYQAGDDTKAIQLYTEALDVPVPMEHLLDAGPRRAVLHCNRAAAYLRRSSYPETFGQLDLLGELAGVSMIDDGKELNLKAAVMDCDQSLQYMPNGVKALYRKATALEQLGKACDAYQIALQAHEHLGSANTLAGEVSKLVGRLRLLAVPPEATRLDAAELDDIDALD
jgi:tetratricopeptide (TPR) repeat protein